MRTMINVKTDEKIKIYAQKLAKEMGLSLSTIINAHLKQFIRNKEVYFSIAPKMSPELENLLNKIEFDIRRKKNISDVFSSKEKIKKHLVSL